MPETSPDTPPREDLDTQIEALLAEMSAACDRVAEQLGPDAPPPLANKPKLNDPAPTPDESPQATAKQDVAPQEPDAEASPEPVEPEASGEAASEEETADLLAAVAAAVNTLDADSQAEAPAQDAAPDADAPAGGIPPLDDLDAELAALAGEMMASSEPYDAPEETSPDDFEDLSAESEAAEDRPPEPSRPAANAPTSTSAPKPEATEDEGSEPAPGSDSEPEPVRAKPQPAATARGPQPVLSAGFWPTVPEPKPGESKPARAWTLTRVWSLWALGVLGRAAVRGYVWVMPRLGDLAERSNRPLESRSRTVRQSVGWFAAMTAFYAVLAWAFVLFIRQPAPPPRASTPAVDVSSADTGNTATPVAQQNDRAPR